MKPRPHPLSLRLLALIAMLWGAATAATADDLTQVTGETWKELPKIAKQAYLVGVSNMVDAEYTYQVRIAKEKPRSDQTLIQRLYEKTDGNTIDGVIAELDAWYKANPDKKSKAVLDVIWLEYVKPKE